MTCKLTSSRPVHWLSLLLGPDAEDSGLDQLVGRLEAVNQDAGEEHSSPFPADSGRHRLDKRLMRCELGAVGQTDRDQVVERPGGVDQGDLKVIGLERDDHRGDQAGGPA